MNAKSKLENTADTAITPWLVAILVVAVTLIAPGAWRNQPVATDSASGTLELADVLSADPSGFAVADRARPLHFPADHGPHPDFRSEWWYFTGNLENGSGRRFGFQLTFFRFALDRESVKQRRGNSNWLADQVYMAHFALSDAAGRRFHSFERFDREALGLSGATVRPFRVWLEPWEARSEGAAFFPLLLRARQDDVAVELRLDAGKPVVLQGDRGLSRKSERPGNASHYYSYTRLPAQGSVWVDGEKHSVTGLAWMDREWSTSALDRNQEGWDWFALQLDDGRDVMFYRLRRVGGATDPHSAGTVVGRKGDAIALGAGDVILRPLRFWRSPLGGRYPVAWRFRVPGRGLDLNIDAVFPAQEHAATLRYWEGAVDVSGTSAGRPVRGRGYAELTGYAAAKR
ncbi:MAG: lipocalin-like domain-containing protein [Gammaproteobacteria bacterium]|nr:lipocalin-like domain-containing protein [Gammaproteobacteria bacterium]